MSSHNGLEPTDSIFQNSRRDLTALGFGIRGLESAKATSSRSYADLNHDLTKGVTRVEEASPKIGRLMVLEMSIKAILFDFYLTIVDIKTDEGKDHLWRVLTSFLQYRGAVVEAAVLREIYFHIVQESLDQSAERYPGLLPLTRDRS